MQADSPSLDMLTQRIDALLPQTQCTRCGYPACRAYAQAIAHDEADINQCPPGGAQGIAELAGLLGRAPTPLNPANGVEKPAEIAVIDEDACIGCTKCIQVCPVDAIIGASKMMHTVLRDECTGCDLCLPACPVDCISMVIALPVVCTEPNSRASHFRDRYETREARLAHERNERDAAISTRKAEVHSSPGTRSAVLEAIARARAKKSGDGVKDA
jgi:Na+-translocating ferredoxin:NAD+ oxidoreductase subunit B